jgi:hypothetical protein
MGIVDLLRKDEKSVVIDGQVKLVNWVAAAEIERLKKELIQHQEKTRAAYMREAKWIENISFAKDEIELLRAALQEYCDGKYVGYVSLSCGWDDWGTLAKYTLEGLSLDDYKADCKNQNDIYTEKKSDV